eukprot:GFYU01010761.1.p1 GENE.GFYU01010761.1~~GFYU01010761.1.p1  ORF type:complete len:365 (+),score=147.69 GFYU01010761.1:46-1095(+)
MVDDYCGVQVQARHTPAGVGTVNSAVALEVGGDVIAITRGGGSTGTTEEPSLYLNGVKSNKHNGGTTRIQLDGSQTSITARGSFGASDATVSFKIRARVPHKNAETAASIAARDAAVDITSAPDPVYTEVTYLFEVVVRRGATGVQFMELFGTPPPLSAGLTEGLLGNFNGDTTDDMIGSTGLQYNTATVTAETIEKEFAESWRVKTETDSILPYADGETVATFYDASFTPIKLSDFTQAQIDAALVACEANGVALTYLQACAVDHLLSNGAVSYGSYNSNNARIQVQLLPVSVTAEKIETRTVVTSTNDNGNGNNLGNSLITGVSPATRATATWTPVVAIVAALVLLM